MKKTLCCLFVLLFAMTTVCYAEAPSEMTCESLAEMVLASADFRELKDMTERYLEKYLILSAEDLEEWVFKRDASRATPEMILIMKVREGADQALIRQTAQELRDEQLLEYRNYQPAEVFKLENTQALENGRFIALIVSPDPQASIAALGEGWK